LFSSFIYQGSSWRYYAYAVFPAFFWEEVFARKKALVAGREILLGHVKSIGGYIWFALQTAAFVGILEALVSFLLFLFFFFLFMAANYKQVQSYFHREIYTVCFIVAVFWPLSSGIGFVSQHRLLSATWAVGCLAMSVFTLLPVIKVESVTAMYVVIFHSVLCID
jgi:phosphatidylinositol glycan class N